MVLSRHVFQTYLSPSQYIVAQLCISDVFKVKPHINSCNIRRSGKYIYIRIFHGNVALRMFYKATDNKKIVKIQRKTWGLFMLSLKKLLFLQGGVLRCTHCSKRTKYECARCHQLLCLDCVNFHWNSVCFFKSTIASHFNHDRNIYVVRQLWKIDLCRTKYISRRYKMFHQQHLCHKKTTYVSNIWIQALYSYILVNDMHTQLLV